MPTAPDFLKAFGLIRRSKWDGYVLQKIDIVEHAVVRWHHYQFNITLTFKNLGKGVYSELYSELDDAISESHIVYGIKNPYDCYFEQKEKVEKSGDFVIFHLVGNGVRIYKKDMK